MAFSIDPSLLGLEDQVALVTGGGQGIAKGCAMQLAKAGCHVSVIDLDETKGRATVSEIEALGRRAVYIRADVLDVDAVSRMVRDTIAGLGSLDIACNVVGNPGHPPTSLLDGTLSDWNATVHRNLGTAFLGTQAAAIAIVERVHTWPHHQRRIVERSGGRAQCRRLRRRKCGCHSLHEVSGHGACALWHPRQPHRARYSWAYDAAVSRDRHARDATIPRAAAKAPPLGRLGDPYETGGLAVFLASNLSSYVTGHALFSDGGVIHTTARPPVGMTIMPEALRHLDWVQQLHTELAENEQRV